MEVSAEIAVMIEQEQEFHRKKQKEHETRKRWNERVRRAVDLLNACASADEAPASKVVQKRWVPAAVAAIACVPAARIKTIELPGRALTIMLHRLLDDPDSDRVRESVVADLEAVLARLDVPREDLFYLFGVLAGHFESLLSHRLACGWPSWLETSAHKIPTELEADPGVKEIRTRLAHNPIGIQKALRVYAELCRDPRDVIPRAALKNTELPPTAVDRVPKSPADVTENPRGFTRTFLLRYVCTIWRPRESKGQRGVKDLVQSTSTVPC